MSLPRLARALPLLASLLLVSALSLHAQYEIESGVRNDLSLRAGGIPVGNPGVPGGSPAITPQFANVVETSGASDAVSASATLSARHPSSSTAILLRSSVGNAFSSGVPRYFLGDRITAPISYVSSSGATVSAGATFWRAEPVRAGEIVTNPSGHVLRESTGVAVPNTDGVIIPALDPGVYETFYYSPHAKAVFASQPGQVTIWWRSQLPDSNGDYVLVREVFSVSSATANPVRNLYWTERSFSAPRVSVPGGRIVRINPVYSNTFPPSVAAEYVPVGSNEPTDPTAGNAAELRTVWFETSNGTGELHAYNATGRILVEYLGAQQQDGTHEFLGADVLEITRAAPTTTLTVTLGEEIRPALEDRTLVAYPLSSNTSSSTVSYYGSVTRPDGSLAYYAERENTLEDRVVFYWLEKADAAIPPASGLAPGLEIQWPKYLHKYLMAWPEGVSSYSHYVVGAGGSSPESGTGLKFEGGNIPTVIFQDDPEQDEVTLDAITQRLLANLSGDQLSRVLLKFTGNNGGVWYVRLMTQADSRNGFLEGDGGAVLTGVARVGQRLAPPSADYSLAGYIAAGTDYSPLAYKDPFAAGVAAAEKGAIIPVNALPNGASKLTVWWFKKVAAPSSEFSDFYTTAKVGHYTLQWADDDDALVLASNEGSGDLPPDQLAGSIYVQNNRAQTGYNPNEEHALLLGGRVYALRDDLNVTTGSDYAAFSSQPRVLLQYTSNADQRPSMRAFRVLREDAAHRFVYDITAGTILNSPQPLPKLPLPVSPATGLSVNTEVQPDPDLYPLETYASGAPATYASFTFKDRKGYDWVYRGPHELESSDLPASAPLANTEFNGSDAGMWSHLAHIENSAVSGGTLHGTGTGDAQIYTSAFAPFPGDAVSTIEIRFRSPSNASTQLFWGNENGGFGGGRSMGLTYTGAGAWQTLTFHVSASADWAGKQIDALRFDPTSSSSQTFEIDWIRASRPTPALGMRWYYTMREGFYFPGRSSQPAEGTVLPYLRPLDSHGAPLGDPVTGESLTVVYRPVWPSSPPTMSVGETLTLPNHGLPSVRGQSSAQVFYQQSIAKTGVAPSVTLHDPTRAKSVLLNAANVGLTQIPASIATTPHAGKTYFQLLPPHLQQRFYLDPTLGDIGGLVLVGEFVDEIAGEDYVHLNVLSAEDVASLKGLVANNDNDAQAWYNAVDRLTTRVETFVEDPAKRGTYVADSARTVTVGAGDLAGIDSPDTAIDSYALTANGQGSGYVTLVFGDGKAFTPTGEPVSVEIVKVLPQLYTGDLKNLPASNPLDEQTTLRHSGDFAGHPEDYEFEWRYAPPQDGVAPLVYSYSLERVLGGDYTTPWHLARNPATALPASYSSETYEFGRSEAINDAAYNRSGGLPGLVLKSAQPLTFSSLVPSQIVFSVDLGTHDGFVLYVNGTAALASRLPQGIAVPAGLTISDPLGNLVAGGLANQYTVPSSFFALGENRIEVAFYSSADAGGGSALNLRFDASVEIDQVVQNGSPWIKPNGTLSNIVVVGGSASSPLGNPLLVFSDNYFTLRYRAKDPAANVAGDGWSRWMSPKLVESWIKRALDGINPFTQRNTDLFNNPVSTDVSILTQAGTRWEGDVALNLDNINDFGLIEIYETLLNRAKNLSIDAGYDDPGTNDTLLLVSGYLNDLYMVLGNEASDDSDNPTISIDAESDSGVVNTSRFSFESQVPTLLDEELALLRGRDDFLSPAVTVAPAYNRLYWNYTNGINSGESIYAINYDIMEKAGGPYADGVLDASDAYHLFPQGHGDAYGHYLTSLKNYYKLLTSPHFTWTPRSEGVSVLGQTVQVDYQDERKFAAAAAAVARVGARILDLTARQTYRDDPSVGWSHQRDGKYNSSTGVARHWSTDEWAARAGQGAYLNWVSANAMLPDVDDNPQHNGIQKIDRTTVPELGELVATAVAIQTTLDGQCAHLNPLGLAKGAIAFDISPADLKAGTSHFEQIYQRALQACLNAKAAFDQACRMNTRLRDQTTSLDQYNTAVEAQERAFEYQLINLYGTAYAGDIGPGKLYAQGYAGPDYYHYYFIDRPSDYVDTTSTVAVKFNEPVDFNPTTDWSLDYTYDQINRPGQYTTRTYQLNPDKITQFAPSGYGGRAQPGAIQSALLDVYIAQVNVRESSDTLRAKLRQFERDYQLYTEFRTVYEDINESAAATRAEADTYSKAAGAIQSAIKLYEIGSDLIDKLGGASAEAMPKAVGLSPDVTSPSRFAILYAAATSAYAQKLAGQALDRSISMLESKADSLNSEADGYGSDYEWNNEDKQHVVEFERMFDEVLAQRFELARRIAELQKSVEAVSRLVSQAAQILSEREIFRQRAAAVVQGYRTRDLTYRTFRNEALSQYQALYDLASQYTYLAAQSYDYETGLLGTSAGQSVIDGVIATRALGQFTNDRPVDIAGSTGDGGLATLLARLQGDWSVVKSRLGINNPDTYGTLFSLRQELFRIRTDAATDEDNKAWKQTIQQRIMSNVLNDPDVALYCRNLRKPDGSAVPGIVIPFGTSIEHGLNFFGLPLAAGDHAYTASSFATKIYSAGVVLRGYIGMDPYAIGTPNAGGPASSNPDALSATPYVYLIPAGMDSMHAPALGDTGEVRSWAVKDHAIPLPFNLGSTLYSSSQFFTPQGTLNEQLWIPRKHQAFRPVNDAAYFYSSMPNEFTNSRLVGRSVWNSQWKLVIPAYTLLNKEQDGLDRFVRSVSDIQLFLRTYSHSGN